MWNNVTQAALTQATELAALEDEAMSFFLEEEQREKEQLKRALRVSEKRGKPFHEVNLTAIPSHVSLTTELVQVKERQKRRKVSEIKEYVSSTLEPCMSSYGLATTALSAVSADGKHITIPLTDSSDPTSSQPENQSTGHSAEAATARTLYLLDRFAVSDQFYHELAQVFNLQNLNSYYVQAHIPL